MIVCVSSSLRPQLQLGCSQLQLCVSNTKINLLSGRLGGVGLESYVGSLFSTALSRCVVSQCLSKQRQVLSSFFSVMDFEFNQHQTQPDTHPSSIRQRATPLQKTNPFTTCFRSCEQKIIPRSLQIVSLVFHYLLIESTYYI